MKNIFKTILCVSVLFFANVIFAADFLITKELPKTNDIKVGDEVLVNVNFLAEGVNYNTFEGVLTIPPNFEIINAVTGNSFVTIWLEDPANFISNTIDFSGITPSGYNKETGLLFSLVVKAKTPGSGMFSLKDIAVYKNDGLGTKENISNKSLSLAIRENTEGEEPYRISVKDTTPPEEFNIELLKDPNLFEGKHTLVWSAVDKGSGIASYDIFEGRNVFKHVMSPYVLENQRLNGKIKVVAYDHEGNTRESTIIPPGKSCVGDTCFGIVETGIGVFILVVLLFIIWRKRKKS